MNGATVLFIDGNHENFERLKNLKSEYLFDNEVGKVNDRIFHLKRGRPYHINGKSIFTFGGATSIDRMYRNQGIDWWAEEVPSKDEVELGLNVACSEKFDYIIISSKSNATRGICNQFSRFLKNTPVVSLQTEKVRK